MKNIILKLIEYVYYLSLATLFVLYLFPGSLIGYLLYGDLRQQPNLVDNPIGTSINHLFYFIYLSLLGLIDRSRKQRLLNSFQFLFSISILLELTHFLIPNRAFEFYDLLANSAGVIFLYLFLKLFIKKNTR
ncbi:hypothetical protein OAS47_02605 [Pelagibacteraceae bacterium]|nr:hypothetical protein [Pelagibacteraceae bacterium]